MQRSLLVRVGIGLLLFFVSVGGLLWMLLDHLMDFSRHEVWLLAVVLFVFALVTSNYVVSLTQRLRVVVREMEKFRTSAFSQRPQLRSVAEHKDELGQLARTLETITERMMQQLARIQQEDQARRELIANVSHDLRTPLASMRGYLDTLMIKTDSLSADERHTYLSIAVEQANHLARLIGDLFDMAKLEAPNASVFTEPCALTELIQDVAQKFELVAAEKSICLKLDVDLETPLVRADIGLMERVLSNLLDNAIRHTPEQGTITIELKTADGRARVAVHDSGRGIDTPLQTRIFEPFYQGTASRNHGGAGLGLSIVSRVLELHQSEIKVESALGQGACFYFELPLLTPDEKH